MLLLILISFACGKGFWGVTLGIALTHWASLARLIRGGGVPAPGESVYPIAGKLGKSRAYLCVPSYGTESSAAVYHRADPHVPHAILHEASITFLGFGLSPEELYHWDHFIGEHEISGHGKMVAGAVSGASSDGGGADVPLCGADHMPDGGSGQCP